MSHADDVFMRQFGGILGFLVVFAFAVYFIASAVGNDSLAKRLSSPAATQERIAPVGSVVVSEAAERLTAAWGFDRDSIKSDKDLR